MSARPPLPRAFLESPLAAAPAHLDRPAIVDAQRSWAWRQIHEAAIALMPRLAGAPAVCNLCTSRAAFLVVWLAALRSRCLMILPPSGGNADIASVLEASPHAVVIGDPQPWSGPSREERTAHLRLEPQWAPASMSDAALAWQPAWDEVAVRLYTSGSTGAPEAQPKTLRHLAAGALVLGSRLDRDVDGGLAAIERIVCSVPPQHMFGLECSVMLPLLHGMPVLDKRPLLPADVHAAFAGSPRAAWIATPLHLHSLVRAPDQAPACSVVIASTMPLAATVARQSERLVGAPVLEIYGSTETGALAMRRTACERRWQPLDGVTVATVDALGAGSTTASGIVAHGDHFASPAALFDDLALDADGAFTLLGRQADVIKIAGRRASLAGLNLLLQELPGLEDGVFYLPPGAGPTERLCLIHSGPPLDRAAVRRWLRARLDPVFLPRTFIHLDRLPRADNGKLRRRSLDAAFSQWTRTPPDLTTPTDSAPMPL